MSAVKHLKELGQQDFDLLLNWLDTDRERAGVLYERIRWRLVTILASRGCVLAEELADETIDRVARRVTDIEQIYVGDKAIYFLGVMNNVHHEYLRRPAAPQLIDTSDNVEFVKQMSAMTNGKAYFANPNNLSQFVLIDFLRRRKSRVR